MYIINLCMMDLHIVIFLHLLHFICDWLLRMTKIVFLFYGYCIYLKRVHFLQGQEDVLVVTMLVNIAYSTLEQLG